MLSDKIIVLMVDEFEELQMRVEDKRISRTVFSNIRHLMQHEKNFIFHEQPCLRFKHELKVTAVIQLASVSILRQSKAE